MRAAGKRKAKNGFWYFIFIHGVVFFYQTMGVYWENSVLFRINA